MTKQIKLVILALIIIALNGCSGIEFSKWHFPYMMQVQQGNYVSDEQFKQLKPGLTKDQAAIIVGHPVTIYIFKKNRWDYIYQEYRNNSLFKSYNVSLFFDKDDKIINITKEGELF